MLRAMMALLLGGCSVVFMEPVPSGWQPPKRLDCSASMGWALWDGLNAVGHGASALWIVNYSDEHVISEGQASQLRAYLALNLVAAAAHAISSGVGASKVASCTEARRRDDAWRRQQTNIRRIKRERAAPASESEIERLRREVDELKRQRATPEPDAGPPPAPPMPPGE